MDMLHFKYSVHYKTRGPADVLCCRSSPVLLTRSDPDSSRSRLSKMSFTSRSYRQGSIRQTTMSVYGGAGGRDTRISTSQIGGSQYLNGFGLTDGLDLHVDANEKFMLQNLNDRLASYIQKVHSMEKENERLEKQIREWYSSKTVITRDYSSYFATIADLQNKIRDATTFNAKLYLEIDNSKLAADDFKTKYEYELSMKQAVEADIAGLKKVFDDLNLVKMDMESQYESLKDELIMLKKNHEEEMSMHRNSKAGGISVECDAPPSIDLNKVMEEIREHYEGVIAKNRRELEQWYQSKITVVEKVAEDNSSSLGASRLEIKELKSTLQRLEIELQSHLSMKQSLEATVRETNERYAAQLAGHQAVITGLEAQMLNLTNSITEMQLKYGTLLDLKTRLEAEIVEYRRLLEGEIASESSKQVVTKTITVEEIYVNGKKVDSSKSVDVDVNQIK
ncbi:keratin, type I cytoskeletal 50 kDa-like isoform X2 [Cyprinodon tularosa]|uniref:keratin, type I cytoskeletal 50 kDa-like isoform X2 n=1 Tax=Cyprinodon tularosa TaxID=77115 RepID=UPI0018E1DAF9|nr:keratin, type I cytoskeletal 50 kDa-like isoform X2 [Cyprinodon tularosa]